MQNYKIRHTETQFNHPTIDADPKKYTLVDGVGCTCTYKYSIPCSKVWVRIDSTTRARSGEEACKSSQLAQTGSSREMNRNTMHMHCIHTGMLCSTCCCFCCAKTSQGRNQGQPKGIDGCRAASYMSPIQSHMGLVSALSLYTVLHQICPILSVFDMNAVSGHSLQLDCEGLPA